MPDITLLGLLVTFLAIILAIPLSVAANLLTPKLSNWWAARTVRSASRAIDVFILEIKELDASDCQEFALREAVGTALRTVMEFSTAMLIGTWIMLLLVRADLLKEHPNYMILLPSLGAYVGMLWSSMRRGRRLSAAVQRLTETGRQRRRRYVLNRIHTLKSRLPDSITPLPGPPQTTNE